MIVIRGVNRKVITFLESGYVGYWIEGIGSTEESFFGYLKPFPTDGSTPYWLQACYEGDECIYEYGDLPFTTAGVGDVSVDASAESSAQYFDLQGRPVNAEQLAPGLYIRRTGSRVEKIMTR